MITRGDKGRLGLAAPLAGEGNIPLVRRQAISLDSRYESTQKMQLTSLNVFWRAGGHFPQSSSALFFRKPAIAFQVYKG